MNINNKADSYSMFYIWLGQRQRSTINDKWVIMITNLLKTSSHFHNSTAQHNSS